MQTSRIDLIATVRRHRDIGSPSRPRITIGETVEQAIARGCRYTVIPTVITHRPLRDACPGYSGVPAEEIASRRRGGKRPPPAMPPPMSAEEFNTMAATRRRLKPTTIQSLRLLIVERETWSHVAAEHGVSISIMQTRYREFLEAAR